ncbi:MAG TPA: DUF3568 family protein [Verrucomicrobiae bacterium]|nr:DUF3568 family protein [Verrucomicrobiae bacterium]
MKTKIFLAVLAAAGLLGTIGCVDTVSGRQTGGLPFIKDTVEGRYERPVSEVTKAAVEVIKFNGTLLTESTLHNETNLVRTVEGKVNQRDIFIRVEPVDAKVTSVKVEARTPAGGGDLDTAHELEKQIALQLVSGPR